MTGTVASRVLIRRHPQDPRLDDENDRYPWYYQQYAHGDDRDEYGRVATFAEAVRIAKDLTAPPSWCTPYLRDVQPAQAITLGTDLPTSFADSLAGLLSRDIDYVCVRVRLYDDEWQPGPAADYRLVAVLDDPDAEGEHVAVLIPTDDDDVWTGPPRRVPTERIAHLHVH